MKNTSKITLCAITASLAALIMLVSYFPYLTYAIPALAGLMVMVPLIEIGPGWAFASYLTSCILVLIFGEIESTVFYICFFGFYPILKALIERMRKAIPEWIVKLGVFNICSMVMYFIVSKFFAISLEDFGTLGRYGAYIFLAICNVAFILYDIAISKVAMFYIVRLHGNIKKILKL